VRVTVNKLAERELNDAAQYYKLEQPGLGAAFITDVRRCAEAVAEFQGAGSPMLRASGQAQRWVRSKTNRW
jgi:plasmid stabilization system protein ParE